MKYLTWDVLAFGIFLLTAFWASLHAVLHKRDSHVAAIWVILIWTSPFLGFSLYVIFGINRIERRARKGRRSPKTILGESAEVQSLPHLKGLLRLGDRLLTYPMSSAELLLPLCNGEQAYPQMIAAIDGAKHSVWLSTYIFDRDAVGIEFAQALKRAQQRGCEVKVLVDGVGIHYSLPSIARELGNLVRQFAPPLRPRSLGLINMRNHRKILVVDHTVGFFGGMNIRQDEIGKKERRLQDLHFKVQGEVIQQLAAVFAEDWEYTTSEKINWPAHKTPNQSTQLPEVSPKQPLQTRVSCRIISDGPDCATGRTRWMILGALAAAQHEVRIVTPYFVPDQTFISALAVCALRGVAVHIYLPQKNNLPWIHWASRALWRQLLDKGCRIYLTEPPFDHSKLMTVDSQWSLVGSSNWDNRSLRLNFELNLECWEPEFAKHLNQIVDGKKNKHVTLQDLDGRPWAIKVLDGFVRLFISYL